jgi:hypothetical protein
VKPTLRKVLRIYKEKDRSILRDDTYLVPDRGEVLYSLESVAFASKLWALMIEEDLPRIILELKSCETLPSSLILVWQASEHYLKGMPKGPIARVGDE